MWTGISKPTMRYQLDTPQFASLSPKEIKMLYLYQDFMADQ